MGSSGAGKTTLMDVLAARKSEGVITGEVKLNGQHLPVSFQRTTGYCEQLDVHLPQATVREALEFSALLRQPRNLPEAEKLKYVDTIIELLELEDIADAIIGEPGAGLGVEQRKRLTIGVELVSRPTLLFLDEPTSGLDGQSSYIIVGFLRKLAAAGQAILCTIHQPSAALFAGFDNLLLLKGGGRTVYFGPTQTLAAYFSSHGVEWPAEKNPAEFMIDIVSGDVSKGQDWANVWLASDERRKMMEDIASINESESAGDKALVTAAEEESYEFAATAWTQLRVVTRRANVQIYRNVEYTRNKFILHIVTGLISGLSLFNIGNSMQDLQNRMFSVFMFAFIAPGVMVQVRKNDWRVRDCC
jgi:ABC-type multidrug transport system ATPase subunit